MKLPFHIVDVFTEKLQGNQLAVFRD